MHCCTFNFRKLLSRGVARNTYTEVGARFGIWDLCLSGACFPPPLIFRPLIQSGGISGAHPHVLCKEIEGLEDTNNYFSFPARWWSIS